MAKRVINVGASVNDKSGDPIRTAFTKVNENFTELYNAVNADIAIPSQANNGGKYLTTNGTTLSWATVLIGGTNTLGGLSDVSFGAAPVGGQALLFDTGLGKWTNSTVPASTTNSTVLANGGVDQLSATAIDLTKTVQKMSDGFYTLDAGTEGQIIYLVQQTGATGTAQIYVTNQCRINGIEYTNNFIQPFINGINNVVTMLYTDNAWQSLGGQWD